MTRRRYAWRWANVWDNWRLNWLTEEYRLHARDLPTALRRLHRTVLGILSGLILLLLVYSLSITIRPGLASIAIWLILALPLILFLPWIWKIHLRAHAWLCFVTLAYFIQGVLTAINPASMITGVAQSVLCLSLFAVLIMFIRAYRSHFRVPL